MPKVIRTEDRHGPWLVREWFLAGYECPICQQVLARFVWYGRGKGLSKVWPCTAFRSVPSVSGGPQRAEGQEISVERISDAGKGTTSLKEHLLLSKEQESRCCFTPRAPTLEAPFDTRFVGAKV